MDYVPDITELPWWTAAQKYRDPNAPDVPDDTEDDDEC